MVGGSVANNSLNSPANLNYNQFSDPEVTACDAADRDRCILNGRSAEANLSPYSKSNCDLHVAQVMVRFSLYAIVSL